MVEEDIRVNGAQIKEDFAGHCSDFDIYSESPRKPLVNTKQGYGKICLFNRLPLVPM